MRAALGLLTVVIALAVGYWFYMSNLKASGATRTPAQVISTVGVKSDLLSMAQAERVYQASHGSYASLDELYSSGTLIAAKAGPSRLQLFVGNFTRRLHDHGTLPASAVGALPQLLD